MQTNGTMTNPRYFPSPRWHGDVVRCWTRRGAPGANDIAYELDQAQVPPCQPAAAHLSSEEPIARIFWPVGALFAQADDICHCGSCPAVPIQLI